MLKVPFTIWMLLAAGNIYLTWGQQIAPVNVTLDKTVVYIWCPVSRRPDAECPFGGEKVKIHVEFGEVDLSLRYRVSGGRIIGSGKDVIWDLANLLPGMYKVLVKPRQGERSLPAVTKTIKLEPCPECALGCTCPTLIVIPSRSEVDSGDIVGFHAEVRGLDKHKITFKWKVENGKIIKGSKTNTLTVQALKAEAGKKLTATVEIGGTDPACICTTIASETVDIR